MDGNKKTNPKIALNQSFSHQLPRPWIDWCMNKGRMIYFTLTTTNIFSTA